VRSDRVALGVVDLVAAFVLAGALLVGGWARMVPGVAGAFHDDGVYALTAKALAEGDGYRLIQLPGAPPQTKYPILYPAFLSLFWDEAEPLPSRVHAMQLATLLLAAAAVAGFYLYSVRYGYGGRVAAFAGAAIAASAPNLLYYATSLLSELPFALALVAALWAADAEVRTSRPGWLRELGVGLLLGLPFLVRSAGIAVAPAAIVALAIAGKRAVWITLGAALVMTPWLVWSAFGGAAASDTIASYQTDYVAWSLDAWRKLGPGYVLVNVGKALAAITHIAFEAAARKLYAMTDEAATIVRVVGALSLVWLALELRRLTLAGLVVAAYLVLVCFWPWAPDRFIVPLLPLLTIGIVALLEKSLRYLLPQRVAAVAVGIAAAAVVASNATLLADYAEQSRDSGYPYFMPPAEPVAWESYREAFDWLRANSGADDVVVAGFDTMTALYAERRAVRAFVPRPEALFYGAEVSPVGTLDDLAMVLAAYRPRYFFVAPMPAFPEEGPLYELVEHYGAVHPGGLTRVYAGGDPRFVVYELDLRK